MGADEAATVEKAKRITAHTIRLTLRLRLRTNGTMTLSLVAEHRAFEQIAGRNQKIARSNLLAVPIDLSACTCFILRSPGTVDLPLGIND